MYIHVAPSLANIYSAVTTNLLPVVDQTTIFGSPKNHNIIFVDYFFHGCHIFAISSYFCLCFDFTLGYLSYINNSFCSRFIIQFHRVIALVLKKDI